ncbi:hypothetical protein BU16DRAFT_567405 [Lophium mytilinum]|uniref:Uncharacterized protein n=1 Tax=Lophium mytilinum TaxID=390894 RepID=A0A6A6QAZ1_9PEZI|nr:hypothetical protein BU16DRAFT_567405 [Lophium mytilinum]
MPVYISSTSYANHFNCCKCAGPKSPAWRPKGGPCVICTHIECGKCEQWTAGATEDIAEEGDNGEQWEDQHDNDMEDEWTADTESWEMGGGAEEADWRNGPPVFFSE